MINISYVYTIPYTSENMHKWFILLMVAIFSASAVLAGSVSFGDVWLTPWTLADSKQEITEVDDQALRIFQVNGAAGTVNVEQTLKFEDPSFQSTGRLMWDPDEPGAFDFYYSKVPLRFDAGTPMFEVALDFLGGFESTVDPITNSLEDLEQEHLLVLGKDYGIVDTTINGGVGSMLLASVLYEHEVNMGVHQVSLPSGIHNVEVANIDVVANTIDLVVDGTPINGFQVGGISSVLPEKIMLIEIINANRVHLGYGVNTIEFTDNNVFDNQFANGVYVDGVSIADGFVSMDMTSLPTGNVLVHSIKYRLHANNGAGGNVLVPGDVKSIPGPSTPELLSNYISQREGLLHGGWDIKHNDLTPSIFETSRAYFTEERGSNGEAYFVGAINKEGDETRMPLVDNSNLFSLGFNMGDEQNNLYFVEPSNQCDFGNPSLGIGDYFLMTAQSIPVLGFTDITFLMNYESINVGSGEIFFQDNSNYLFPVTFSEQYSLVFTCPGQTIGHGTIAGTHDFWVDLDSSSQTYLNIIVDYNQDGVINQGETDFMLGQGPPWGGSPTVAFLDLNTDNNGIMQQEPFVDAPLNTEVFIPASSFLSPIAAAERFDVTIDEVVQGMPKLEPELAPTSSQGVLNAMYPHPSIPQAYAGVTPFGVSLRFFPETPVQAAAITMLIPPEQRRGEILVDFTAMPVCDDGIDNDFDGLVDLADPDCNGNPLHSSELGGRACGDIDNDASVSILDVLLAAQHAAAQTTLTGTDFACGDVDSDMDIDVFDTLAINQFAAGYATTLICTGCV